MELMTSQNIYLNLPVHNDVLYPIKNKLLSKVS